MYGRVAPLAGAWIEIAACHIRSHPQPVAPLAGAWIEITVSRASSMDAAVAPLAGAWIEIVHQQEQAGMD